MKVIDRLVVDGARSVHWSREYFVRYRETEWDLTRSGERVQGRIILNGGGSPADSETVQVDLDWPSFQKIVLHCRGVAAVGYKWPRYTFMDGTEVTPDWR